MNNKNIFAFIPARKNSKRVKDKNIRNLNNHPMLAYTINAAIKSNSFKDVICITDSLQYASIAEYYGANVIARRPKSISGDKSPDIEWVKWILEVLKKKNIKCDIYSILRPTCPLRDSQNIKLAFKDFFKYKNIDSLRAVEKCKQHPGKMWIYKDNYIKPLIKKYIKGTPWHSSQYASLPKIYIQNASIEIAWSKVALKKNSISGNTIVPYFSKKNQGFDINEEEDFILLNELIKKNKKILPRIKKKSWFDNLK